NRSALAIAAGFLLACPFPNIGLAGMAWIAPGFLFCLGLNISSGERFRIGYLAGLVQALFSFYWLLLIPYRWHSIPLGPASGWLALSAYLACYPAVWLMLCSTWPFASRRASASVTTNLAACIDSVFNRSWA